MPEIEGLHIILSIALIRISFFLFLSICRQGRTNRDFDPYTVAVPEAEQTAISNLIVDGKEWLFFVAGYSKNKCIVKLDVLYYPSIIWMLVYPATWFIQEVFVFKHKCGLLAG